jgi:hypothetical protein
MLALLRRHMQPLARPPALSPTSSAVRSLVTMIVAISIIHLAASPSLVPHPSILPKTISEYHIIYT